MTKFLQKVSMLCLAAVASLSVSAQTFDKQAATISWAVGNESEGTLSDGISDAVSLTKVSVGTDLKVTSTSATYTLGDVTTGSMVTYQPITSNPGCVAGDMIEYTVQLKKGLTFTPTSVSFDAVKEGTDGAYFSWSYTVDGTESDIFAYSDPKTQIRRNNNANPTAPLNHDEAISDANGGQKVTLRFYLSNVANNKKMSIGNIKINGIIDGEVVQRAFKNFELNFMNITELPATPEGVTSLEGTCRNDSHGLNSDFKMVVPVDGPVKITLGGCQYSGTNAKIMDGDNVLAELDVKTPGCYHNGGTVSWTYNSETPTTLTIVGAQYNPYIKMEACDLIPMRTVTYYGLDGTTIIGSEEVEGGSALVYKYGSDDVLQGNVGVIFRGWFNSTQTSAVKVMEGTSVQENLSLYAKATTQEVPYVGAIFTYPLNSTSFYPEDHEAFATSGTFHDAQHGYSYGANGTISVQTAGNAVMVIGLCKYGNASKIVVKDAAGNQVGDTISIPVENDGATASVTYIGEPTTLTATIINGGYIHNVTVYNVAEVPQKNEAGYYALSAGDGASLQLVIAALQDGDKIYLPNGTYDFGTKALTTISANNVSIIGESMEGTIIVNAPAVESEGIGTTATLLNTSNNLYLQDLTIQNALDYYGTGAAGRAVCLQDKGANTICKNVKMLSYQDTYYSNKASNFYWEDSEIHGTVDYLCGDGDVVYNRCKFVNESRSATEKSGSDVLCAPYQSEACKWGYVFLDCEVSSLCKDFTFARSWGGNSAAQFIRTKVTDNSLNASRWTVAGMNVAAYNFKEYGTMDADGNVTTPESNVVTFTHSSGNKTYETVLPADTIQYYTPAHIYGEWNPEQYTAQVTEMPADGIFLVNGEITNALPAAACKVRVANVRGGFGPEIDYAPASEDDLTRDMFHHWSGVDATATIEETTPYYNGDGLNVSTQMVYGNSNVYELEYADLSAYSKLVITTTEGAPRCLFNRLVKDGAAPDNLIDCGNNDDQRAAYMTEENGVYTIDLAKIVSDKGFAHLLCIKGAKWGNVTVTSMKLVKADTPTAVTLVEATSAAQKNGKFVKNGQVVILKNGKLFNACGAQLK